MNVLIIDGHPDGGRLTTTLLEHYAAALPAGVTLRRLAVRDLAFNPNLGHGYGAAQPWEADLAACAEALTQCDHLVIGFPMWWGSEPALVKGLLDRILLPGFSHKYHPNNPFWDRLLAGRSADVIITMDTPPWYQRLVYGDPVGKRWRGQVLGFCGFKPVRVHELGPTRRGEAAKRMDGWKARLAEAAQTAATLKRAAKSQPTGGESAFATAVSDRRS